MRSDITKLISILPMVWDRIGLRIWFFLGSFFFFYDVFLFSWLQRGPLILKLLGSRDAIAKSWRSGAGMED